MGAREKNSSDRHAGSPVGQGAGAYCFPEIGQDKCGKNGSVKPPCLSFQPLVLGGTEMKASGHNASSESPSEVGLDLRAIEQEAYRRGYMEGEMAGRESSRRSLTPVINTLEEALKELARIKRELRACAEKEAVELALAVARKIVCQEVSSNNQIVLNVVREALKRVENKEEIVIKINPSDLKALERIRCDSPELFREIGDVVFRGDPAMSSGGCVIETNLGDVDARIEKQLMAVEEAFRSELSASAAE